MANENNLPNFKDTDYKKSLPALEKMRAFKIGVEAMRNEEYLFKAERETDRSYKLRKKLAALYNATDKTISAATGFIFRKPLVYENLDKVFDDKDVDNQKTIFNEFAKDLCNQGIYDGLAYILVDSPSTTARTRREEIENKIKPYFTIVNPINVINKRFARIGGDMKLIQVTIQETVTLPDGEFGEKTEDRYRVLRIGGGTVYKIGENDEKVELYSWNNSLNYIPLIPFYANKTGFFKAKPPFLDLADLNLIAFNMQSQLYKTMWMSATPVPVIYGDTAQDKSGQDIVISSDTALRFASKDRGGFEFVEFSGVAIEKMQSEIDRLEQRMALLGISLLTKKDSPKTATEATIDLAQETSDLSSIALSLEWALNSAYNTYLEFAGKKPNKEDNLIRVNRDFVTAMMDTQQAQALIAMHDANKITLDVLLENLIQGEFIQIPDVGAMKDELDQQPPGFDGQ